MKFYSCDNFTLDRDFCQLVKKFLAGWQASKLPEERRNFAGEPSILIAVIGRSRFRGR